MRKFLIVTLAALCLAGCSKFNSNPLAGSSYRTDGYQAIMSLWGHYYHIFEFSTATEGIAYWTDKQGYQNGSDGVFTYTVEGDDVYITPRDKSVQHYRIISSRAFVLIRIDGTENPSMTYYKL